MCRAHWPAPENHAASFFIIPRLRAGDFGNAGEIKQGGVKLHLFPAQPHILAANGKQVKVLFQRAVFNGMNGVEIFTKQLQVAEIVFQQLPALANFIGPCRLRRRGMGAGKHAVAVKAVIFAIEFSVCTNCVMAFKSCQ